MSLMASVMELFLLHNIEYQPESLYYDVAKCIGTLIKTKNVIHSVAAYKRVWMTIDKKDVRIFSNQNVKP